MQKIVPAKLAAGDEIRVVAPARGIRIIGQESREIAAQRFAALGLKVSFGRNTTDENWDMTGSSPIEDRIADIHEAFADKKRESGVYNYRRRKFESAAAVSGL